MMLRIERTFSYYEKKVKQFLSAYKTSLSID